MPRFCALDLFFYQVVKALKTYSNTTEWSNMFYIVFVSLFLFNVFLVQNYSCLNCGYNGLRAHGRVKHFLEENQDCVNE